MATRMKLAQEADEKVRQGAALLDGRPELAGWRDRIDTEMLDIDSSLDCVLGQVFGNYSNGKQKLGISSEESFDCGFAADELSPHILTAAWVRYLSSCATPVSDIEVPDVVKRDRVYELVKLAASGKRLGLDHIVESAIAAALAEVNGV